MKHRLGSLLSVPLLLLLVTASHAAQVPRRMIFVGAVGDAAPPATTSSQFKTPIGVTMASSAGAAGQVSVFVADPYNGQILMYPSGGGAPTQISTLTCPNAVKGCYGMLHWTLSRPLFVATGSDGNIWVDDTDNDVVLEFDPATSTVLRFAGQGPSSVLCGGALCAGHPNSGQGNGQFLGPGALAVDSSGNLYVVDDEGQAMLNQDAVNVYFSPQNTRIQKFRADGSFIGTFGSYCLLGASGQQVAGTCDLSVSGAQSPGDGEFSPLVPGIATDNSGNVYVVDEGNGRVLKYSGDGKFLLKWGSPGSAPGALGDPTGIAVDFAQAIYVADSSNDRVEVFDGNGTFLSTGGSPGVAEAEFRDPFGIATVPPSVALLCLLAQNPDCIYGLVVTEHSSLPNGNLRAQFLAERQDTDNDGITDDVDVAVSSASDDFSNAGLGFTTTGKVQSRGDQTFAIYGTFSPTKINEIRVRTESTGGAAPLVISWCGTTVTTSFSAASGINMHCSTPTLTTEYGPVGFRFVGSDGTVASATLHTGDGLTVNPGTSQVTDNAGSITLGVGARTVALSPGQTATVLTPNFALSALPMRVSMLRKQRKTFRLTATPGNGFTGQITLGCGSVDPGVDCVIHPAVMNVSGTGPVSASVLVTVDQKSAWQPGSEHTINFTGVTGFPRHGGLERTVAVQLRIRK